MNNVTGHDHVSIMRFTDKLSAFDFLCFNSTSAKDVKWLVGEGTNAIDRNSFEIEAERVLAYPRHNGIMFHGYHFHASGVSENAFQAISYRLLEHLSSLYSAHPYDGKCMGALIHGNPSGKKGVCDRYLSIIYSACQTAQTYCWPAVIGDDKLLNEYLSLTRQKWSNTLSTLG